jgi:hypothetical protein
MAPIHAFGIHHFWNALQKSSEWKSLADLALVLMTMPLAEADNECLFSLKRAITGITATGATPEQLRAGARIKVHVDPK